MVALGSAAIFVVAFAVAMSWASLSPALSLRTVGLGTAVIYVGTGLAIAITSQESASVTAGLVALALVTVVGVIAGSWLTGWRLRVYHELNVARADSARLAIAEERLRISRDLHDVFGRTLATVAVKSELAAELIRRGRTDEAAGELDQVRAIADQAGQDVRRVLRGYRKADLMVELQGAQSLLAAAGIQCEVRGDARTVGPVATSTLAWVTREAVTNLIKHSNARQVEITIDGVEPVVLTVTNDGVRDLPAGRTGQGLIGMAERVAEAGGVLQHQRQDGQFAVRVELPNPAEAPR